MERLVHIVPLGWERVRVSAAIADAKAHEVHLLSRRDDDLNAHFLAAVRRDLRDLVPEDELHEVPIAHENEFESVLFHVSRLIVDAWKNGDRPYVHLAGSSKTAAVAAGMAASYHAESVGGLYYASSDAFAVQAENPMKAFHDAGLSTNYQGIRSIPLLRIRRPREAALAALAFLYENPGRTIREITRHLAKEGIEPFDAHPKVEKDGKLVNDPERADAVWDAKLRRLVLKELLDEGLVEPGVGPGRALRYKLTAAGRHHALMTGLLDEM